MGQRKKLSPQQELNPRPPEHRAMFCPVIFKLQPVIASNSKSRMVFLDKG